MTIEQKKPVPWYAWPFVMVWRVLTGILKLTGRLLGVVLGLALLAVGVALSVTVVGAILGVPLAVLGFLLIMRSLF